MITRRATFTQSCFLDHAKQRNPKRYIITKPQTRKKRKLHCPLVHQQEVGEMPVKFVEFYSPKDSRHRPTDFKDTTGEIQITRIQLQWNPTAFYLYPLPLTKLSKAGIFIWRVSRTCLNLTKPYGLIYTLTVTVLLWLFILQQHKNGLIVKFRGMRSECWFLCWIQPSVLKLAAQVLPVISGSGPSFSLSYHLLIGCNTGNIFLKHKYKKDHG